MTSLQGKTILITGAGSGIGRLMAERAAVRGAAHVVLWDINQYGLDNTLELIAGRCRVSAHLCDVSDRAAVRQVADEVLLETGGVDIAINNAGIVSGKSLLELSDEAIERTFDINTLALFWITRAFLPGMIERRNGHIVTIASAGGLIGVPRMTDYSASKFAAVGFDESLRVELQRLGATGVRTTVVCPYFIGTGMFDGVKTRFPMLLPIMEPQDVAERILRAIESNKHRLIMPPFVNVLYPARLLPVGVFDKVVTFFGINHSMDEFRGRGGH